MNKNLQKVLIHQARGKHISPELIPALRQGKDALLYEIWLCQIPDYTESLDAMHAAENDCLFCDADKTADRYENFLKEYMIFPWNATAEQRAEALLKTLDLWERAK